MGESILDILHAELEAGKETQKQFEYLKSDKKRMSEELFSVMTELYNRKTYEERKEEYK